MKINSIRPLLQSITSYHFAVALSSVSIVFGILREFLIVGLLGFTSHNDRLQLYLSIFYTIGLSIDAMRLACLNLYTVLSLPRLLLSASIIGLPFSIILGLVMSYATGGLDLSLLCITIIGSYLNLIAALLITYSQRNNYFLTAQFINVMPNLILIPGILICYGYLKTNLIYSIVCLTSLIPVAQCILLLPLSKRCAPVIHENLSLLKTMTTFARHFSAMTGEQLFQIITRSAFYRYGSGYLSVYAMIIRIYSALRFILIDSFIGSKLAVWKNELTNKDDYLSKMMNSTASAFLITVIALIISLKPHTELIYSSIQIILIFIFGFYLSTLVRVIYFKINHQENNSTLVLQFAAYEIICALCAFLITKQFNYPILALLWIGYIVKPFAQLLLLRKRYRALEQVS